MGVPTGDGPDLIINKLRDDVMTPWIRPIGAAIAGAWLLFVLIPSLVFADGPSTGTFIRWSAVALAALALTFAIPALVGHERPRAVVGTLAAAAAMVALVWVATA